MLRGKEEIPAGVLSVDRACGQGTVKAQARQRPDGAREAGPGLRLQDFSCRVPGAPGERWVERRLWTRC